VTTRAPTKTWRAKEGKVYINYASAVTIDGSTTLSGVFGAASGTQSIEAACKNITITPPETSWEKQDLLGEDTNGFQNQLLDEKPVGIATFTGSLVLGEDETIEDFVTSGTVSAPAGYTRYQIGKAAPELAVCVVLTTNDKANQVAFAFDNARVTKWGDVRITGPDAHWEQDVTIICLAKDFYWEFKD